MSDKDILVLVGARIREIRKQRNLSQVELAEKANTQDTYIGGVERGVRNISLLTLERITQALDVPIHEIFQFGEIKHIEGIDEKQIIAAIVSSKLQNRSLAEVQLVKRMLDDLFATIDEQNHK